MRYLAGKGDPTQIRWIREGTGCSTSSNSWSLAVNWSLRNTRVRQQPSTLSIPALRVTTSGSSSQVALWRLRRAPSNSCTPCLHLRRAGLDLFLPILLQNLFPEMLTAAQELSETLPTKSLSGMASPRELVRNVELLVGLVVGWHCKFPKKTTSILDSGFYSSINGS